MVRQSFSGSYLFYKALAFIHRDTLRAHALDELKETNYAAIFAVFSVVAVVGM